MNHYLEIRIARSFTLEQVEILADHLRECITSANDICPGLEDCEILIESVDVVITDDFIG